MPPSRKFSDGDRVVVTPAYGGEVPESWEGKLGIVTGFNRAYGRESYAVTDPETRRIRPFHERCLVKEEDYGKDIEVVVTTPPGQGQVVTLPWNKLYLNRGGDFYRVSRDTNILDLSQELVPTSRVSKKELERLRWVGKSKRMYEVDDADDLTKVYLRSGLRSLPQRYLVEYLDRYNPPPEVASEAHRVIRSSDWGSQFNLMSKLPNTRQAKSKLRYLKGKIKKAVSKRVPEWEDQETRRSLRGDYTRKVLQKEFPDLREGSGEYFLVKRLVEKELSNYLPEEDFSRDHFSEI